MKIYASQGARGQVTDLDTKLPVRKVIWYDIEKQELEAYQVDRHTGEILTDVSGSYLTYRAKGRFSFRAYTNEEIAAKAREEEAKSNNSSSKSSSLLSSKSAVDNIKMGAPICARCPSTLTLMGDDLCVTCRAKETGQRNNMKVEKLSTPLLDVKCSKCSKLALWSVADEVDVTPEIGSTTVKGRRGKRLFTRGSTVGRRYYCDWHYKPPRLLDSKGEVIEDISTSHRPNYS